MLIDKPNIELLRLVAQCKDFPAVCSFPEVFMVSTGNADTLIEEGLLSMSRDGTRYRVAGAGYELLNHAGVDYPPDRYRETDPKALCRRERSAQVMMTLLLAGVDVYTADVPQLHEHAFLSAGTIRRNQRSCSRNRMGNTRFTGLMGSGYVIFYVADPQESLYFRHETRVALDLLAQSRRNNPAVTRPAVIYMGTDYRSLCTAMTRPAGSKASYRSAYDKFDMPVHLCPCNPDGAFQMRTMLQPNYREKLVELVMGVPQEPNPFYPGCDGILNDEPFIIGVDMDLKRITYLVQTSYASGAKTHIFVRRCQSEVLKEVLPAEAIQMYAIEDEEIQSAFSFSTFLVEPPLEPYVTKDGAIIHDSTIQACREARKADRKKGNLV